MYSACLESGAGHDRRHPGHDRRSNRRGSTWGQGGSQEPGHKFHEEPGQRRRRPVRIFTNAAWPLYGDSVTTRFRDHRSGERGADRRPGPIAADLYESIRHNGRGDGFRRANRSDKSGVQRDAE